MTDYERYLEKQAVNAALRTRLNINDVVYVQHEQFIHKGQVIKLSEKSAKLKMFDGPFKDEDKNFSYIKLAKEGDFVALVWEAWRGLQGRGGYRWEREAYQELRNPVESIPPKAFVCEEEFLKVNKIYEQSYLDKINQVKNKKSSPK